MADREPASHEVRVSDRDAEMVAIKAIASGLEPLDLDTRIRVLEWAKARFVEVEKGLLTAGAEASLMAQMKGLTEEAERLGVTVPRLVHTIAAVRERNGLAPIDATPKHVDAELEGVGHGA